MSIKPFLLAGALAGLLAAAPAYARDHGWHRWHDNGWHGDHFRHFHGRPFIDFDIDVWRGGYWDRGWHDGRFGWWWTVGPGYYYYYPRAIYPYPEPYGYDTTVVVQPPPVAQGAPSNQQSWYYCDDPKGYYPYVSECKEDWRPVPVTPPGQ